MSRLLEHGRYALYDALGAGAAASVHLGVSRGRQSYPVAIKRLHEGLARDSTAVARLFDEVRLSRHIVHPNVVKVIDFVSDGVVVLAIMDYFHGEPLSRLLNDTRRRQVRVPVTIAAAIARDMLRGLQAAHEARDESGMLLSIVHRDATPENVLVGADGTAKITDFGVAKADGRLISTTDGGVRGKIAYLAPEQVGGEVSAQTDVYAAGLVLWEMLAGERPLQGGTEAELLVQVLSGDVPAIRTRVEGISATLEIVLARATAKSPDRRYASAALFADAIERAVPVATPGQLAAWVRDLAGERLSHREELIRNMLAEEEHQERHSYLPAANSSPSLSYIPIPFASGPPTDSRIVLMPTSPGVALPMRSAPPPRGSTARNVALVVAALAMVGVGVAWGSQVLPKQAAHTDPGAVEVDAGIAAPPASVVVAPAAVDASAVAVLADAGSVSAPEPVATPAQSPGVNTRPKTAAPRNCDPPWVLDAKGIRRYKPQCMP